MWKIARAFVHSFRDLLEWNIYLCRQDRSRLRVDFGVETIRILITLMEILNKCEMKDRSVKI